MSIDLTQPAHRLLALLTTRDISAAELLEATLTRIEAINPALNALVTLDAEAAREAARLSDARRAAGEAGPLEGLPISIKDCFEVAGLRSTCGAQPFANHIPAQDAGAVARLRAAGAIILAKSNVPPFCGDFQTANPIFGRTNNPWNLERSPGGSSGGAAAAIATGMSALELGTDLGSSIRWPAHATGIFGLKTSFGVVPLAGNIPPAPRPPGDADLSVAGPMARSATDLTLAFDILTGNSRRGIWKPLLSSQPEDARKLRIGILSDDPFSPVAASVKATVEGAAQVLSLAGATVETARLPVSFAEIYEIYAVLMHALALADLPAKVRAKVAARGDALPADDTSHIALQARGAGLSYADWLALTSRRTAIKAAFAEFFSKYDALLMPPAPVAAILHDDTPDPHGKAIDVDGTARPYFDLTHWAAPATVAHLPAVVAPITRLDGLPHGVQIVCAEGADRTAIAIAGLLEQLGCAFVAPPM